MSELLVVVPPGWTQLDWTYITNNVPNMTHGNVSNLLAAGVLSDIEGWLKEAGIIAAEASLLEAKLIDDAYFIVRLG